MEKVAVPLLLLPLEIVPRLQGSVPVQVPALVTNDQPEGVGMLTWTPEESEAPALETVKLMTTVEPGTALPEALLAIERSALGLTVTVVVTLLFAVAGSVEVVEALMVLLIGLGVV